MKKAIVIAMADEPPFIQIKENIYPMLTDWYAQFGYETFFVYGRNASIFERNIRKIVEKIRWTRFYPILRIYDLIVLFPYKWFLPKSRLEGKNIFVNVPEDLRHLSIKTLSSLFLLDSLGYEVLIRTTVSSILVPQVIEKSLSRVGTTEAIYSGRVIYRNDESSFVSGSLIIFKNGSIDLLREKLNRFDFSLLDDVAFGKFFRNKTVKTFNLQTMDISERKLLPKNKSDLIDVAQIRCKSGVVAKDRVDEYLMMKVVELLKI